MGRCELQLKAKLESSRLDSKLAELKLGTFITGLTWFQFAPHRQEPRHRQSAPAAIVVALTLRV
jgi:hypothetical protein